MNATTRRRAARDLDRIGRELLRVQECYRGREMPADVGRSFEEKAREAEAIRRRLERADRAEGDR